MSQQADGVTDSAFCRLSTFCPAPNSHFLNERRGRRGFTPAVRWLVAGIVRAHVDGVHISQSAAFFLYSILETNRGRLLVAGCWLLVAVLARAPWLLC